MCIIMQIKIYFFSYHSLVADVVLFNSEFNRKSFLDNINKYMKLMPDYRPNNLKDQIEPKSHVLYFIFKGLSPRVPSSVLGLENSNAVSNDNDGSNVVKTRGIGDCGEKTCLHIVWPHRW